MKYLTLSKKLTIVLSKGVIVNNNNPIESHTKEEISRFKEKGWKYYLFTANEDEDFDFLYFGQWVKDIKFFVDNVYFLMSNK